MALIKAIILLLALATSFSSAAEENLRKRDLTFCWWPYVYENGHCTYCKNDFVCPANSYRISHRTCYDSFDDCACNHGYCKHENTCIPVKAPTNAPVKPPTNAPVKPPTKAPRRPPTAAPVKPPTKAPRNPPAPVPVKPPVDAPVKPPVVAPVKPPVVAPVKPPVVAPVKPPVVAPVKPPTKAPRRPPTAAPVKPPTKAPRKPPTNAPVKPPTQAPVKCPYPQEWIDGCCKDVCKNDYVCPHNSYRIEHRACYDSFDDCACNYGYYKASHEAKCVKYWWCTW